MLNRREILQRIAGLATASGLVAQTSVVDAESHPVLAVFETKDCLDDEQISNVTTVLEAWLADTALCGCRVLVLGDGNRLTLLDATGRVCNFDVRTLLDEEVA